MCEFVNISRFGIATETGDLRLWINCSNIPQTVFISCKNKINDFSRFNLFEANLNDDVSISILSNGNVL